VPTSDIPSALSCWDHSWAGWSEPPSFDFHTKKACPVVGSTNGLGSMAPPRLGWHSNGPDESSVKVASVGESAPAVATERQSSPVSLAWPDRAAS